MSFSCLPFSPNRLDHVFDQICDVVKNVVSCDTILIHSLCVVAYMFVCSIWLFLSVGFQIKELEFIPQRMRFNLLTSNRTNVTTPTSVTTTSPTPPTLT